MTWKQINGCSKRSTHGPFYQQNPPVLTSFPHDAHMLVWIATVLQIISGPQIRQNTNPVDFFVCNCQSLFSTLNILYQYSKKMEKSHQLQHRTWNSFGPLWTYFFEEFTFCFNMNPPKLTLFLGSSTPCCSDSIQCQALYVRPPEATSLLLCICVV